MTTEAERNAAKYAPTAEAVVVSLRRGGFNLALQMGYYVSREAIAAEAQRLIARGEYLYAALLTFCHSDGELIRTVCAQIPPDCEAQASERWLRRVDPQAYRDLIAA